MHYRVLLIDNSHAFFNDLKTLLSHSNECQFTIDCTQDPDTYLHSIHQNGEKLPYDIYLIDEEFEQANYSYLEDGADTPIILLTQPLPISLSTLISPIAKASNQKNAEAPPLQTSQASPNFSSEKKQRLIDYLAKDKLSTEIIVRNIHHAIEQTKSRQQLEHLSLYDSLTGIPNRLFFQTELSKTFAQCSRRRMPFALVLINIDRFKSINDSLGHYWGDQCLVEISQRLEGLLKQEHFVARLGSDEFAVVIRSDSSETILKISQSITKKIRDSLVLNDKVFKLHSSIGIANFPKDGLQERTLLTSADQALRHAKQTIGSKISQFQVNRKNLDESWVEAEFPNSLREQQLFLEYQMQVDTQSRQCTAVEALCRWLHPEKGLIPPDSFIPTIEKTPMIYDLGLWVINEACKNINKIRESFNNQEIKISINVSPSQLHHTNFIHDVKNIIQKHNIDPNYIELELTESALINQPEKVISILKELQQFGISFAIDDFGKGYSSLSYLVDLPINVLKIDRGFTADFINNKKRKSVIHAIVALSKGLELKTVAEGVEDARTANYLMSIGCDTLQGYYIGRPKKLYAEISSNFSG